MSEKFESFNPRQKETKERESKEISPGIELNEFLFEVEELDPKLLGITLGEEDSLEDNGFEFRKEVELIRQNNADFLEKTGLDLEARKYNPFRSYFEKEQEKNSLGAAINIKDKKKFLDFLNGFQGKINEEEASALESLGIHLDEQLVYLYDLYRLDEDFLTLVSLFESLAQEYRRFSQMTENSRFQGALISLSVDFSGYHEAVSKKYLREYLAIEKFKFDYYDAFEKNSVKKFEEFWQNFLTVAERVLENKGAHNYLKGAFHHYKKDFLYHAQYLKKNNPKIIEHIEGTTDHLKDKFEKIESNLV